MKNKCINKLFNFSMRRVCAVAILISVSILPLNLGLYRVLASDGEGTGSSLAISVMTSHDPVNYKYEVYKNPKYSFSISYPSVYSSDKSAGLDREKFISALKDASLTVYGEPNAKNSSLESYYNVELSRITGRITHTGAKKNYYIISWDSGDSSYYKKVYIGPGCINGFVFQYPKTLPEVYSPIIEIIEHSFKTGNLNLKY